MKAPANRALVPISACLLSQAVRGEAGAMKRLADRAVYIQRDREYTYWPCRHETPCPEVTEAQMQELVAAIPALAPVAEHRKEVHP